MAERLDTAAILSAWQTGQGRAPLDRALALLWAAGTDGAADLTLAERDRHLLQVHRATFGGRLDLVCDCPECGETLEVSLEAAALAEALELPAPVPLPDGQALRDPTSRDLAAVLDAADATAALRHRLTGGATLSVEAAQVADTAIEARAAATETTLRLSCDACGCEWTDFVDVPAIVWARVEGAAERALAETARLAAAFGWAEAEILAMNPVRRQAYLDLAGTP
ncbi:MAG: hypothetical protein AAGH83_07545 [Pseudomonadota bacterium]